MLKSSILVIYVIVVFLDGTICPQDAIYFVERTYPQVTLSELSAEKYTPTTLYHTVEERQKLCFYARLKAELPYINYSYVPEWKEVYVPFPVEEPVAFGMYCATLPTVYIIRKGGAYQEIQITYLQTSIERYSFNAEAVEIAVSVEPTDSNAEFSDTNLAKLNLEERRNLCVIAAQKYVPLHFLDNDVAQAQSYAFHYGGHTKSNVAIPCPTAPKAYLCRGNSELELQIVLLASTIDDYEFDIEERKPILVTPDYSTAPHEAVLQFSENPLTQLNATDRRTLCIIARRFYDSRILVPFVEETDVPEARLYLYQYENGESVHHVAIACSSLPSMFLRVNDSSKAPNQIIVITLPQSAADRYTYKVIVGGRQFRYLRPTDAHKVDEAQKKRLETHPFTIQGTEYGVNLCLGAQKYLLEKENWTFSFTRNESVVKQNKVLVIPKYVESPRIYSIMQERDRKGSAVVIKCSTWPDVYIRLGESSQEIEIILESYQLHDR